MGDSWPAAIFFGIGALATLVYSQTKEVATVGTAATTTATAPAVAAVISAMVLKSLVFGAAAWVVMAIPVAVFQAYRAKLRELDSTNADLLAERQRNTPNIKGSITGPIYYPIPAMNLLAILLPITLRNPHPAAASALNMWRVSLTKDDSEQLFVPDRFSTGLSFPTSTGTFRVGADDDITAKATTAIQPGGILEGYLAVVIPGRTAADINGARISAHFMDVNEQPHRIDTVADTASLKPTFGVLAGTGARFEMSQATLKSLIVNPPPEPAVTPGKGQPWTKTVIRKARWLASKLSFRRFSP